LRTGRSVVEFLNIQRARRKFKGARGERQIKMADQLLSEFGAEAVEEAMLRAAACAKHPWGVRFIRRFCEE